MCYEHGCKTISALQVEMGLRERSNKTSMEASTDEATESIQWSNGQ